MVDTDKFLEEIDKMVAELIEDKKRRAERPRPITEKRFWAGKACYCYTCVEFYTGYCPFSARRNYSCSKHQFHPEWRRKLNLELQDLRKRGLIKKE